MEIENNGRKQRVTSQAQGNFNTVGSAAGIASFLGLNLPNVFGTRSTGVDGCTCNGSSDNDLITKYEANLLLALTAKDAEIANLKSDQYTDRKLVEVTQYLDGKFSAMAAEMRKNKEEQQGINMQQAVYNGANTATIQCMQSQVQQLLNLAKLVIPNSSVCPGWGNVNNTPSTTPATA